MAPIKCRYKGSFGKSRSAGRERESSHVSTAWVGVVGSLGGVALGGGITLLLDKARWRHEKVVGWREDRRPRGDRRAAEAALRLS